MRRLLLISLGLFTLLIFKPMVLSAETSRLRLPILPVDCVFDTVQDGSNEIIYLTPEECGQLIEDDESIIVPDGLETRPRPISGPYRPVIVSPHHETPDTDGTTPAPDFSYPPPAIDRGQTTDEQESPANLLKVSFISFAAVLSCWLVFSYFIRPIILP